MKEFMDSSMEEENETGTAFSEAPEQTMPEQAVLKTGQSAGTEMSDASEKKGRKREWRKRELPGGSFQL